MASILIVDDEPGVRSALSGVLRDEGYDVDVVENGEACLDPHVVRQDREYVEQAVQRGQGSHGAENPALHRRGVPGTSPVRASGLPGFRASGLPGFRARFYRAAAGKTAACGVQRGGDGGRS